MIVIVKRYCCTILCLDYCLRPRLATRSIWWHTEQDMQTLFWSHTHTHRSPDYTGYHMHPTPPGSWEFICVPNRHQELCKKGGGRGHCSARARG
uniref:Putative secreted protein n=1 Tax=Anopheles darlingi TaxID=43151 RepID=A0A2M4D6R9_ANODA